MLESIMLQEKIAIVHVPGHQQGNSRDAQGNNLADKAVKEAAFHPEVQMLYLTLIIQVPFINPFFTPLERVLLKKMGVSQTPEGKWLFPDG
jgi:hypothetical protein